MKIVVVFHYLTHYYNTVLNRLNDLPGVEIVVIVPSQENAGLGGGGINQTDKNARFRIIRLPEVKLGPIFYSFNGLFRTIARENPSIVLFADIYVFNCLLHFPLIVLMKIRGIKTALKSIPFQVPKFKDATKRQFSHSAFVDRLPAPVKFVFVYLGVERSLRISRAILYRWAFQSVDAHINYIDEAVEVFGSYGVPKERIFITYNSPDTDLMREADRKILKEKSPTDGRFRLIHVGRLVFWKRVDLLIGAFANLRKKFPELELLIVGDGPEMPKLKALASELNISNGVKFLGGIYDYEGLGRELSRSNVYVLAGMGGLSINDAMFFRLPIICSICDGTEKVLVREGENGYYFKEGDPLDLEKKIELLVSNPTNAAIMGKASRKIIDRDVNIHTVINGYINAFNYLVGDKLSKLDPVMSQSQEIQ